MNSFRRFLNLSWLCLALVACGGGGGPVREHSSSDHPHSGDGRADSGAIGLDVDERIARTRSQCIALGNEPRPVNFTNDIYQPACLFGERLPDWEDSNGTSREACLFEPPSDTHPGKLPLVIWLHPSLAGPDLSLAATNVRSQIGTANLSGDPQKPGFLLLAPLGRVIEKFYSFPEDAFAVGWDNWYRQLLPDGGSRQLNGRSFAQNVDAAAIDHYLDEVISRGRVDERRIYVMGWSNGGAMGILYALNRRNIAAAAVYSAPNPFNAFNDPCAQAPVIGSPANDTELEVFNAGVPIFHVQNACDYAGICPNGVFLQQTLAQNGVTQLQNQILNTLLGPAEECRALCGTDPRADYAGLDDPLGYLNLGGYSLGVANHNTWPLRWTDEMFAFLREQSH